MPFFELGGIISGGEGRMKFYLSVYSTPELRDLPRRKRCRLWHEAQDLAAFSGKRTIALFATISGAVIAYLFVSSLGLPGRLQLVAEFALGIVGLLVAFVIQQWHIRSHRPILRELRERDYGENRSNGDTPPGGTDSHR